MSISYKDNNIGYSGVKNTKYASTNSALLKNMGLDTVLNQLQQASKLLQPYILTIDQSGGNDYQFPLEALLSPIGIELVIIATGVGPNNIEIQKLDGEGTTNFAKRIQQTLGITEINSQFVGKISLIKLATGGAITTYAPTGYDTVLTGDTDLYATGWGEAGFCYLVYKATNVTPGSETVSLTIKKLCLK